MENKPLFGPVDQVVNTLEMEASWVKGEIERCEESIARKKAEIEQLTKRQNMIQESMKIVRDAEKKRQEMEEGAPAGDLKDVKAQARKAKKS